MIFSWTLTGFIFTSILFAPTLCRRKIWTGNNRNVWQEQRCYDSVKFEPNFYSVIEGPEHGILINKALELPTEGVILLAENSVIAFNNKPRNSECNQAQNLMLNRNSIKPWFSVDNWAIISSNNEQIFNKATPDIEKIPCSGDQVEFTDVINVDLQFAYKIEVQNLKFNTREEDNVNDFLRTQTGQMMFLNGEDTLFTTLSCDSDKNCPCPTDTPLCMNMVNNCPASRCTDPIQPSGFCCKICGAFIHFKVGSKRLDLKGTANKIKQVLKSSSQNLAEDSVEYYVSLVDEESAQVIIVDKEDYGENSPKIAEYLKKNFIDLKYPNQTLNFKQSGSAYEPISDKNIFTFIFLPLFVVLGVFGFIYIYHYDTAVVPRLLAMARIRQINPNDFVFARFDNRRESVATVAGGAGLNAPIGEEIEEEGASAFNNPMFEAKLDLKEATGTKVEEPVQIEDTKFVNVDLLGPVEE